MNNLPFLSPDSLPSAKLAHGVGIDGRSTFVVRAPKPRSKPDRTVAHDKARARALSLAALAWAAYAVAPAAVLSIESASHDPRAVRGDLSAMPDELATYVTVLAARRAGGQRWNATSPRQGERGPARSCRADDPLALGAVALSAARAMMEAARKGPVARADHLLRNVVRNLRRQDRRTGGEVTDPSPSRAVGGLVGARDGMRIRAGIDAVRSMQGTATDALAERRAAWFDTIPVELRTAALAGDRKALEACRVRAYRAGIR